MAHDRRETVVRDDEERPVDPVTLVRGDVLALRPGFADWSSWA